MIYVEIRGTICSKLYCLPFVLECKTYKETVFGSINCLMLHIREVLYGQHARGVIFVCQDHLICPVFTMCFYSNEFTMDLSYVKRNTP